MGARLVFDLNPSGSSSPQSMISIDGMLYFTADLGSSSEGGEQAQDPGDDANNDEEQTPDSEDDSNSEEEVAPRTTPQSINNLGNGLALLKSDGTAEGTRLLKEFQSINDLVDVNGELYFIADDGTGNRLWKSDGTARGTVLVKDLYPGADPNFPQDLFEIDGVLFYAAINSNTTSGIPPENGYELWRREGSGIGSPMFKNIIPDRIITEVIIDSETDEESGETETTTTITTSEVQNNSFPRDFTAVNGNLFFVAATPYFMEKNSAAEDPLNLDDRDIIGGLELWFSDGTESGTKPVTVNTNLYDYYAPVDVEYEYLPENLFDPNYGFTTNSASSFPRELTSFANNLVFVANDGFSGFELWTVSAQGDNLRQIADLSQGNTSSSPEQLTVVGDRIYFTANIGDERKLWSTTSALDRPSLVEGAGDDPKHLTNIDGKLYFSAKSELGRELWVANGNNATLVADIKPGSGSSSPKDFTIINHWINQKIENFLYFSADGGERGVELWSLQLSSNDSKPQREADIYSGPYSSEPRQLINAEQNLFFTANDGECGRELWTLGATIIGSNGKIGPELVSLDTEEKQKQVDQFSSDTTVSWSLNGGADEKFFQIQENGTLSFEESPAYERPNDLNRDNIYEVVIRATDISNGVFTDQKVNVNVLDVINIEIPGNEGEGSGGSGGSGGSYSNILVEERQKNVYQFNINESTELALEGDDAELFQIKSNGLLRFINAPLYDQPADSDQDNFYDITLTAVNPVSGTSNEQDITIEVVYVVDIQGPSGEPGSSESYIQIEEKNNDVFNFTSEKEAVWELTGGADKALFNINPEGKLKFKKAPNFDNPTDANGDNIYKVIVGAKNPYAGNLSNQTVDIEIADVYEPPTKGTLIKDIFKGPKGSNPSGLIQFKKDLYFASRNNKHGTELWQSQGNKSTTYLVKDINPGEESSAPFGFTIFDKKIYFSANDGDVGVELWSTDGSKQGTKRVADIRPGSNSSSPSDLAVLDNKLLFGADDGKEGFELWGLSKGSNNPKLVSNINSSTSSTPKELTKFNQKVYFSAQGDVYGRELWETDGTKDGTKLVIDINPGGFNSNPEDFTIFNEKLYFTAETYAGGRQVWSSDGSEGGTKKISPLVSQSIFSNVEKLTSTKEQLFFSAKGSSEKTSYIKIKPLVEEDGSPIIGVDGNPIIIEEEVTESEEIGRELWSMKGHPDSIKVVLDINPGAASSNPTALTSINDLLYFSADNGIHGEELWMSDGTPEGTLRLTDINEGSKNSAPRDITAGPDGIYFSAIKDNVGRELWRLDQEGQSATRIVTTGEGKKKLRAFDDSNDEFRFELANQFGKAKADRITGFSPDAGDKLALSTIAFQDLSEINLVTVSSRRQLKAQQKQLSNLIYYEAKGKLYFDQNGPEKGFGSGDEGGLFAILKGGPDLTESNFLIV